MPTRCRLGIAADRRARSARRSPDGVDPGIRLPRTGAVVGGDLHRAFRRRLPARGSRSFRHLARTLRDRSVCGGGAGRTDSEGGPCFLRQRRSDCSRRSAASGRPSWTWCAARSAKACPSPSATRWPLDLPAKTVDTFAFLSDGELQEGQIWEAAMFAAHNRDRMGPPGRGDRRQQLAGRRPGDVGHDARAARGQVARVRLAGRRGRRSRSGRTLRRLRKRR